MGNFNEKLNGLKPYVTSIRMAEGITVIDTVFNDGWEIPIDTNVGHQTLPEKPNYYMLHPLNKDTGLDEMLDYVQETIRLNVEREKKVDLLTVKVRELEAIFMSKNLKECESLTFTFKVESKKISDTINIPINQVKDLTVKKDNKAAEVPPSPQKVKKQPVNSYAKHGGIDLPPKKGEKIVVEDFEPVKVVCKCGPEEVCPECVDSK
tara:strand:- start:8096 stop:8716 length:621 start_codon:yes stop_codon:yes gene_type:complete